jgi:hypothetical protein
MLNLVLERLKRTRSTCIATDTQSLSFDRLSPLRQWLNRLEIRNAALAHFICRTIPVQCPFARTISLFGHTIIQIPPLCKLNPLYEEVVFLRFRALCYLADDSWGFGDLTGTPASI